MSRSRERLRRLQKRSNARAATGGNGEPDRLALAEFRLLRERQQAELARIAEKSRHAQRLGVRFARSFECVLLFLGCSILAGATARSEFLHDLVAPVFGLTSVFAVINARLIGSLSEKC